jgi:hypothetical protein
LGEREASGIGQQKATLMSFSVFLSSV